eukprot:775840-Amphidinium_carterae.1
MIISECVQDSLDDVLLMSWLLPAVWMDCIIMRTTWPDCDVLGAMPLAHAHSIKDHMKSAA